MRNVLCLLFCVFLLAACGKKPNYVEAPEDTKQQKEPAGTYPRGYPKPWL